MATKKRSSSIAITCLIVLVAVIAAVVLTSLFKDCKFGHKYDENGVCVRCGAEKAVEENDDAAAALGDDMLFATVSGYGISVTAAPTKASPDVPAAIAANSQTLTATITPSDATNKSVDWEIAWKNAASTWASGKNITEYLTVAPSSDGALTATVTCKQAFGEQAIVTVTSRDNPDAKATCTVDYKTRLLGVQLSVDGVKYSNTDGVTLTWMGAQTENSFNSSMTTYINSIGTIEGYHVAGSVTYSVQYEQSYVEAMAKCAQPSGRTSRADFYAKKSTSTFYANNDYAAYASKALTISHRYFFAAFDGQRLANALGVPYQVWSNTAAAILKNNFNNKKIATIFVTVPIAEGAQTFEVPVTYDMTNIVSYVESVSVGSSIAF